MNQEDTGEGVLPTPLAADPPLDLPSDVPGPEPATEEPARSLADDLRDLATDARTALEAEKAFQSARLSYASSRGKKVAIGLVLAAVLGYFAVVALVVGLLLALAPLITPWGALAVVTLSLLVAALLAYRSAMSVLRRMKANLMADPSELENSGAAR